LSHERDNWSAGRRLRDEDATPAETLRLLLVCFPQRQSTRRPAPAITNPRFRETWTVIPTRHHREVRTRGAGRLLDGAEVFGTPRSTPSPEARTGPRCPFDNRATVVALTIVNTRSRMVRDLPMADRLRAKRRGQ
jgi:hypothetical protein